MPNDLNTAKAPLPVPGPDAAKGLTAPADLNPQLRTLGPAEIAQILGKSESTIRREASTNPENLPPRFKPPGCNKVLWLEHVVIKWVSDVQLGRAVVNKVRTGRRRQVPA